MSHKEKLIEEYIADQRHEELMAKDWDYFHNKVSSNLDIDEFSNIYYAIKRECESNNWEFDLQEWLL